MISPDEIRRQATGIILDHARDVEYLSISEHLEKLDLPEVEHDAACEAVADAIRTATVTVEFPEPTR